MSEIFKQFKRNSIIKVIFNIPCNTVMYDDLHQKITNLEKNILQIEGNMVEFERLKYEDGIKKSIQQLESDLKYLSILANGAPIDKKEDQRIMDFLRIHYDNLQKFSIPA
ncbi:MAG: hypothetical protein OEQ15_05460 [Nitrosopumilus sp.]|nr:hypothetical protein [Nitrosopumilus sp.]MDH3794933.1 hypothetical protein [Nitrosopumilus sp.]MDH3855285.1 hypothetical protein [Nitrosopumilus sp.]